MGDFDDVYRDVEDFKVGGDYMPDGFNDNGDSRYGDDYDDVYDAMFPNNRDDGYDGYDYDD